MLRDRLLRVLVFVVLFFASHSSVAFELRTAAQHSTPKYFKDDAGNISGICVDILRAIERADPGIRFSGYQRFVPFKRLQHLLDVGQLDVFLGFKNTASRKQKLQFIDTPLYQLNYVLAVRKNDGINVNALDELSELGDQGRVLTVQGSAAAKFLKAQNGLLVDSAARTPSILLKMLVNKRGRFAFYHDLGLQSVIDKDELKDDVRIIPVSFSTYFHYVAFSKQVSGDKIARVREALESLMNSGELANIQHKYSVIH